MTKPPNISELRNKSSAYRNSLVQFNEAKSRGNDIDVRSERMGHYAQMAGELDATNREHAARSAKLDNEFA